MHFLLTLLPLMTYPAVIIRNLLNKMKELLHSKKLCVEWGSTNTGRHIDIHHVKLCTHMKCEVRHNLDMGMGHLWLNGWDIYDLIGGAFIAKMGWAVMASYCFVWKKMLVFKGVPIPIIA